MKYPYLIDASPPSEYKSRSKKEIHKDKDSTVYTTEYRNKRNPTVKPRRIRPQTHQAKLTNRDETKIGFSTHGLSDVKEKKLSLSHSRHSLKQMTPTHGLKMYVKSTSVLPCFFYFIFFSKQISEYDQEIPQSHTAGNLGNQSTLRRCHKTLTVTRHQEDN